MKIIYKSVTDGKFSEALRLVHAILHIIPLTTVETRKEVDELKELIEIARYVLLHSDTAYDPFSFTSLPRIFMSMGLVNLLHMLQLSLFVCVDRQTARCRTMRALRTRRLVDKTRV